MSLINICGAVSCSVACVQCLCFNPIRFSFIVLVPVQLIGCSERAGPTCSVAFAGAGVLQFIFSMSFVQCIRPNLVVLVCVCR